MSQPERCDAPGSPVTKAKTSSAERMRRKRARDAAATELTFVRHDWQLFLHPDRLPQKAGCRADQMRALALKELVDNALDQGVEVELQQLGEDIWTVVDRGQGMDAATVQRLFAVDRPLTSTKLLRRPTRGAVGNGLRVVTGAAIASGGRLWVESRGQRFEIVVDRQTGATEAMPAGAGVGSGTKVVIQFGPAFRAGDDDGHLARAALRFPGPAIAPNRSHLDWYDDASWRELAEAAPAGTTVAQLLALMGIEVDDNRQAVEVPFGWLEALDRPPAPKLLPCGEQEGFAYAKKVGPDFLVEVWAKAMERVPQSRAGGKVQITVNRTPTLLAGQITGSMLLMLGSELFCALDRVPAKARYQAEIAITAPVVPIVNDGKTPDLRRWKAVIAELAEKALRTAYREIAPNTGKHGDLKSAAWEVMEEAYLKASGDGENPANARQIMYAARPMIAELTGGKIVADKYFTGTLLPDFIATNPDLCAEWDVIYDARGHLIEPHTGRPVPLGTTAVRSYLEPRRRSTGGFVTLGGMSEVEIRDRYRTALFIEKEGFLPLLQKAEIAERFDCAIMSTKGTSVVACRHLLDRLGQDGTRILIAHDFDRAGLVIAHTLANDGRRYVFEHQPEMIDIGLRLHDVEAMDLQSEPAPDQGPTAATLRVYGATPAEVEFLCRRHLRVELNAMTSPQFIAWLEAELTVHGAGKVVPPPDTLAAHAREALTRRLLERQVRALEQEARQRAAEMPLPADLEDQVRKAMAEDPSLSWGEAVAALLEGEP